MKKGVLAQEFVAGNETHIGEEQIKIKKGKSEITINEEVISVSAPEIILESDK